MYVSSTPLLPRIFVYKYKFCYWFNISYSVSHFIYILNWYWSNNSALLRVLPSQSSGLITTVCLYIFEHAPFWESVLWAIYCVYVSIYLRHASCADIGHTLRSFYFRPVYLSASVYLGQILIMIRGEIIVLSHDSFNYDFPG